MLPNEEIARQESEENEIPSKPFKEEEKEIDLSINMNPYGFTFMVLFVGIFGYLVISSFTGIPPFKRDLITSEFLINDTILTLLIVLGLIFLGLGVYFGWIHKFPEKEMETETESVEAEETMLVYVDDSLKIDENNIINNE